MNVPPRILQLCILLMALFFAGNATAGPNFVRNERQWPEQVRYRADLPGGAVFFASNRFVYSYYSREDMEKVHEHLDKRNGTAQDVVRGHAYEVSFAGCDQGAKIAGNEQQSWYHNYYLGKDPSRWAAHVPVYGGITYGGLYPGIDLAVYGKGNTMKYDFIVAAGADASVIRLNFNGVKPRLTSDGAIEIRTSVNTVYEEAPYAYQMSGGVEKKVSCRYKMNGQGEITFEFPDGYDRKLPLVIDPTLVFATFSGSTGENYGASATYDQGGNVYAMSSIGNVGWPVTLGAFQTAPGGGFGMGDIGINKYNPTGTTLIYSTYLGGNDGDGVIKATVNSANELIIFGNCASTDFPTTAGCYDNTVSGNSDFFVTHFNATGTALIGSTYIGGSDFETTGNGDVTVDASGNIVCVSSTNSTDFPVTAGVYQSANNGGGDGCIFKFNPTCSSLLMSTFLGGTASDGIHAVQLASNGNIVVCGFTGGSGFPTTPGTANPAYQGGMTDGFVSIFNPSAASLLQSSFLGSSDNDDAVKLQLDDSNKVYVSGNTQGNYPVTPGAYTNANGSIFIHLLSPTLTNVMSTRVGPPSGFSFGGPMAFLVDGCKSIYYAIFTGMTTLPLTPNAFQNTGGIYIAQINSGLASLNYATYLGPSNGEHSHGQSTFDKQGNLYTTLCMQMFTTTPGVWSPTNQTGGVFDGLNFKFHLDPAVTDASFDIDGDDTGCAPFTVTFTNNSSSALSYFWDFGDGNTSTLASPTHTYMVPDTYQVMLVAHNSGSCKLYDTAYGTVVVYENTIVANGSVVEDTGCLPFLVQTVNTSIGATTYEWDFGDGTPLVPGPTPTHLYPTAGRYRVVLHAYNLNLCTTANTDTFYVKVLAPGPTAAIGLLVNDSGCAPYLAEFNNMSTGASTYLWDFGDGTTSTSQFPGTHLYSDPGSYEVVLYAYNYDSLVCKAADTDRIMIHVYPPVKAEMTVSDTSVCEGDAFAFAAQISNAYTEVAWDFGDGTKIGNIIAPSHAYDTSGTFDVVLTISHFICPDTLIDTTVTVVPIPKTVLGPDTSICLYGEPIVLANAAHDPAHTHLWNTGDTGPSILARHHGVFWMRTTNAEGCSSTDSVEVFKSCYIDVPNAFTPNGDGTNDFFFPRQLLTKKLTSFKMQVFNRWGQIVFETNKADGRGWDGKFNDKDQPQGVYIYVIEAEIDRIRSENYKGNVTLLR